MPVRVQDLDVDQLTPEIMSQLLLVQNAMDTPFIAQLVAQGYGRTVAEEYKWFTDGHASRRTQINNGGAAYTSGTTALVVDAESVFYPHCLVLCEATGEIMYCTAVNSSTHTITVVRGLGSVVAAHANSVADDAYLVNIGAAAGEGAKAEPDRYGAKTENSNYVQTFKQTIEVTDRMQAVATQTTNPLDHERNKKSEEIMRDIELAFLFGAKGTATDANGKRVTTTAGIVQAITSHVTNVGGNITRTLLDEFAIEKAFAYGSSQKLFLVGNQLAKHIHALYHSTLRTQTSERAVGMKITDVETAGGTLKMVNHRLLTGAWSQCGIVIDMPQCEVRQLGDLGKLGAITDKQDVDTENKKEVIKAILGLYWGAQQNHALLKGVSGTA